MRLRTFTASDMPTAMKMVREAMGDDAIILSSETKAGRKQVSVTAALDDRDPLLHAANAPLRDSDFDQIRFEIQNRLRFHNIPEMFVSKIMARASDKELSQRWPKNAVRTRTSCRSTSPRWKNCWAISLPLNRSRLTDRR